MSRDRPLPCSGVSQIFRVSTLRCGAIRSLVMLVPLPLRELLLPYGPERFVFFSIRDEPRKERAGSTYCFPSPTFRLFATLFAADRSSHFGGAAVSVHDSAAPLTYPSGIPPRATPFSFFVTALNRSFLPATVFLSGAQLGGFMFYGPPRNATW